MKSILSVVIVDGPGTVWNCWVTGMTGTCWIAGTPGACWSIGAVGICWAAGVVIICWVDGIADICCPPANGWSCCDVPGNGANAGPAGMPVGRDCMNAFCLWYLFKGNPPYVCA